MKANRHKPAYPERSSFFTPKAFVFIFAPHIGDIKCYERSIVPLRIAYIVASIALGVTFAKYEQMGIAKKVAERVLKSTSEKNMKAISEIPKTKFHLLASTKLKKSPVEFIIMAKNIRVLVSIALQYAL